MRNTFLIDPKGKIVKVWTKVDPQVHSEEVLAAIAAGEEGIRQRQLLSLQLASSSTSGLNCGHERDHD